MIGKVFKVLLVEHMEQDVNIVREALERSSGAVFELDILRYVGNGDNRFSNGLYDAVLMDMQLTDPCGKGAHSIGSLKTRYNNAPFIVLAEEYDEQYARCALKAGASDYLIKSQIGPQLLERSIRLAIENSRHHQSTELNRRRMKSLFQGVSDPLLLVDTNWTIRQCNQESLESFGRDRQDLLGKSMEVLFAGRAACDDCRARILNHSGDGYPFAVESTMQRKDGRNFAALLKTTGISDKNGLCCGFLLSVKDLTCERQAITDYLTSLYNRRFLKEKLNIEFKSARRYGHPLSLSICDLDHFKSINDSYGHNVGDGVLQSMGRIMTEELRGENVVGRYGGDEFMILFPYTSAEKALVPLERLRRRFEKTVFRPGKGKGFRVAATFGVAELGRTHKNYEQLFEEADEALYSGKQSGRNRISIRREKPDLLKREPVQQTNETEDKTEKSDLIH